MENGGHFVSVSMCSLILNKEQQNCMRILWDISYVWYLHDTVYYVSWSAVDGYRLRDDLIWHLANNGNGMQMGSHPIKAYRTHILSTPLGPSMDFQEKLDQ